MKTIKLFHRFWVLLILFGSFLMASCQHSTMISTDPENLDTIFFADQPTVEILNPEVDLYVDYSSVIIEAIKNSEFFRAIRPRITGTSPSLYAIKGLDIEFVSSNMDTVNTALNRMAEYHYADLQKAADMITRGNNQGVLMSDGEQWSQGFGERTNLPYLRESFERWLDRGLDVYILIEPYEESHAGKSFDKFRYYIFYTDDDLENNIYEVILHSFRPEKFPNIQTYKVSNSDFSLLSNVRVNEVLGYDKDQRFHFDYIEIQDPWDDILDYVLRARNDTGNPIENGTPLLHDMHLNQTESYNYLINKLGINAYNITDVYLDSLHNMDLKTPMPESFIIDQNAFAEDGSIDIHLSENITKHLHNDKDNLIRIDIIMKDVLAIPPPRKLFVWESMSKRGEKNVTVYESIKQSLDNTAINPMNRNDGLLHSIILKTNNL